MTQPSRYVVGLDLGTTNSALAYIDTTTLGDGPPTIHDVPLTQLVKAGEVGESTLLPSFLYLPADGEIAPGQMALPWAKDRKFAAGVFARDHGAQIPTRLVASAKSWLCHTGIDRRSKILPWTAEPGFAKISPIEASVRYLEHLRDAWNHKMAGTSAENRLENQDIVLTAPASFDAVARELTVEAAKQAGLTRITLFEEPQAAFYSWLCHAGDTWRKQVRPGDVCLVVDVGGGTTDLTLIGVSEQTGDLTLSRIAVGDHLLLGGDNMDLTLAHHVAKTIQEGGTKLDSQQMLQLWHGCRGAKEVVFASEKNKPANITLLGKGRKLVGGTIRTELDRNTAQTVLVDGFFPKVDADAQPAQQRGMGLQEIGLSYASDPAITRHLAAFLQRSADAMAEFLPADKKGRRIPTALLFNGGVFQAQPFRERVLDVLNKWSGAKSAPVRELPTVGLDRAVAHGAAYYGLVRRGLGVRIRGGAARSYYIGVESAMPAVPGMAPPMKAVCVAPQGMEEGTEAELPGREFGLVLGQPVEFRFLGSSQRRGESVGAIVEDWEGTITELPTLKTTLSAPGMEGQMIPVRLHTILTEIGVLEVWCQSRDGKNRWKLEFNLRDEGDK